MDTQSVSGVILAAGMSSRMKQDKRLLPVAGKPLLQHVIDNARASVLHEVVLVMPESDAQYFDTAGCTVVPSPNRQDGLAESLKAGVAAVSSTHGCMVLLGDMPLVMPQHINALIAAFTNEPLRWLVPCNEHQRGNPVIIPAGWLAAVQSLSGDMGARQLFSHPEIEVIYHRSDDKAYYVDVDTQDMYVDLLEALKSSTGSVTCDEDASSCST